MQPANLLLRAGAATVLLTVATLPLSLWAQETDPPVVINEVLADPPADLAGDANGDGVRDTYADEFIELVNRSAGPVDVSGWILGPAGADPFTFPPGTRLAPGEYVTLFGGGEPTTLPGRCFVDDGRLGSGLSNTAGRLLLIDPAGPDTLQDIAYAGWDTDAAWVRDPEGAGDFCDHATRFAAAFSPAGPATPDGGPDTSAPMLYRTRIVNLTSAGFGVAWRSSTAADGRLEILSGSHLRRTWDGNPAGLLHLVEHYGLNPGTTVTWRVVSAGTPAPADTFTSLTTGTVVTSVPRTVYGCLVGSVSGEAVGGAQVFLRLGGATPRSGWLATRSDSTGCWALNLGNLRTIGGSACSWAAGDTLTIEADGAAAGVASGLVTVSGDSPQEVILPALATDPPPIFTWLDFPVGAAVDSVLLLEYSLADPGQAWATLTLQEEGGSRTAPALTVPQVLDRTDRGTVAVELFDLPEGTLWRLAARVEDGLNPPATVTSPAAIRIAHRADRACVLSPGVTLITPTLDDPACTGAFSLLSALPAAGEVARWDQLSAAWCSALRLTDGSTAGDDFTLVPGAGYAVVSTAPCTLTWHGPRRYDPPSLARGGGLALVGVCDSTRVRTAAAVLDDPAVLSVSSWDGYRQAWRGCFRTSEGELIGEDFTIGWGDAVAIDIDSLLTWQPAGTAGIALGRVGGDGGGSSEPVDRPALEVWAAGPGTLELLWAGSGPGQVRLISAGGQPRWSAALGGDRSWHSHRISGLEAGRWRVELTRQTADGERRWTRAVTVAAPALPAMPRWCRGAAPHPDRPLLLTAGGTTVRARTAGLTWYADLAVLLSGSGSGQMAVDLRELAPDGGWRCTPLDIHADRTRLLRAEAAGPGLAVSGLETTRRGPLLVEVRWQVLAGGEGIESALYAGYGAPRGGGGPPGDDRLWLPTGIGESFSPPAPPGCAWELELEPGPQGQAAPEAVAVRIVRPGRPVLWLGPAALTVPQTAPEAALLPAVPNPFNPETCLRYRVPAGGSDRLRLEIRDVRGRCVRLLIDRATAGGDYQVRWDGTDNDGRRVAAGVYLVVLELDRRRMTRKILLLK